MTVEQDHVVIEGPDEFPVAPLNQVLTAISDPIRLEMVRRLSVAGDKIQCSGLYEGISRSTGTHHFKVLREAGVISRVVEGHVVSQRLNELALEQRFPGLIPSLVAAANAEN
ncbi:ArsR/SmtB family transcription factor [Psychromicrobium lacuslunae]|uniref:ArsR/SmtB family transcription factor n=1 Tax=Psychromicrobium lacuslunae TaxID=1618207 RepID=UPI0005D33F7A|nr:helix-turn-helix domain-containing protein [Psychromicrobium lacuslunae]